MTFRFDEPDYDGPCCDDCGQPVEQCECFDACPYCGEGEEDCRCAEILDLGW